MISFLSSRTICPISFLQGIRPRFFYSPYGRKVTDNRPESHSDISGSNTPTRSDQASTVMKSWPSSTSVTDDRGSEPPRSPASETSPCGYKLTLPGQTNESANWKMERIHYPERPEGHKRFEYDEGTMFDELSTTANHDDTGSESSEQTVSSNGIARNGGNNTSQTILDTVLIEPANTQSRGIAKMSRAINIELVHSAGQSDSGEIFHEADSTLNQSDGQQKLGYSVTQCS